MVSNAKTNYYTNFIDGLKQTEPRTWMKRMKRLGKGPGEGDDGNFKFENENGKSDLEITEEIATFFSNISSSYLPINRENFEIIPPGAPFCSSVPADARCRGRSQ